MSIRRRLVLVVARAAALGLVLGVLPSLCAGQAAPAETGRADRGRPAVARQGSVLDVEVLFAAEDVSLSQANGYWAIGVEGCRSAAAAPGHPLLPARLVNVLLPRGMRVASVEATADEVLLAKDVLVYPAQPEVPVSTPADALPEFVQPDAAVYAMAGKLPAAVAELTGQHLMRGHGYASLRIWPVRYDPAARELYLATRITVRLHCAAAGKRGIGAGRDRRGAFREAVAGVVVNGEMLEELAAAEAEEVPAGEQPAGLTDYLIITSNALATAFQPLADHRAAYNGFTTDIVSVETILASYPGSDVQARIRACIVDYVENRGTTYVVLGGDNTVVADRDCYVKVGTSEQSGMPTDLYYAGLDSTWDEDGDGRYGEADTTAGDEGDLAPDVYVGRIPVRTAAQAAAYINKVIQFDTDPIPSDRMILMGKHIGSNASPSYTPYAGTDRPKDVVNDGHLDFASHDPISDVEMWTRRMYRDRIQPYGPPATLGLFFDTLTSWDAYGAGSYALDYTNIRTQLNKGWFHVFMMTHGATNNWSIEGGSYSANIAAGGSGRLGIIYTGSCQTARFDDTTDPCLSEAFLRDAEGPVAYFGCSREGWYSPDHPPADSYSQGGTSMDYAHDFYDQAYRVRPGGLAKIFYGHKTANAGYCGYNGAYRWIMFGMNYQGDPALLVPPAVSTRTLTVNVAGQGGLTPRGRVDLDPPGGSYPAGTTVQLTAVPTDDAWWFLRWEGGLSGSTNPTGLVLSADTTVTAVFGKIGDIDGDGAVNVYDIFVIAESWNTQAGDALYNAAADLDGDGFVNVFDIFVIAEHWNS